MDKKNKIFFAVFFTLIAAVVIITFMKYFVARDYYIQAEADCDPYEEKCFIWECDPDATDESEKCTGDPEKDIWYYKKVKKIASQIPLCDPNNEDCNALACGEGLDCEETLCDKATSEEEGAECNDPVKYTEENPPVDEEECAPDDTECLNAQADEEECAEDDQECLDAQAESEESDTAECAPDDKECLEADGGAEDSGETDESGSDAAKDKTESSVTGAENRTL